MNDWTPEAPSIPGVFHGLDARIRRGLDDRAGGRRRTRLATSIKQGTVTASLMLIKLGSYPRQNDWPWCCASWVEIRDRSLSSSATGPAASTW